MELVSIIIPMYNAEKTIKRCLESVSNQSYKNLEILVVNDGSTDSSLSICEKNQEIDNRIKIINKANGGVSAARNEGLDTANGDYITFVDSDDYIDRNMIKALIEAAEEYDADIVEGGYATIVNENVQHEYLFKFEKNNEPLESLASFLSGKNNADALWNKLYNKKIVENIRFLDHKFSEDFLYNVRAFLRSKNTVTIDKIVYFYDITDENSATNQKITQRNLEDIVIRENLLKEFSEKQLPIKLLQLLQASILKKIIFLDIRVIKDDNDQKKIREFLNFKFKEYMKKTQNKFIMDIKPRKVLYCILLRKYFPRLYKYILRKYFVR